MPAETTSTNDTTMVSRQIVRWGTAIIAFGFLFALAGAALLGRGAGPLETPGDFFHQLGKYTMLAGLITILIGYRWPQIRAVLDDSLSTQPASNRQSVHDLLNSMSIPPETVPPPDDRPKSEVQMTNPESHEAPTLFAKPRIADPIRQRSPSAAREGLGGGIAVAASLLVGVLIVIIIIVTCPLPVAIMAAIGSWLMMASAMLVITLCHVDGPLRAFAIASLVPTLFFLWAAIQVVFQNSWGMGMRGGDTLRPLCASAWLVIAGLGVMGIVVRVVVVRRK